MNPGESRAKMARKERENQTNKEKTRRESEVPGQEGEEVQSPKRKLIRVESEETQDYVRESLNLSRV